MIIKKVALTGGLDAGKTSIFNRILYQKFEELIPAGIGVKVDKKTFTLEEGPVSLLIWDIAGDIKKENLPPSYLQGSSAIIYLFDLSDANSWDRIGPDIQYFSDYFPDISLKVVGNKLDVLTSQQVAAARTSSIHYDFLVSAKTGENVEALFLSIAGSA